MLSSPKGIHESESVLGQTLIKNLSGVLPYALPKEVVYESKPLEHKTIQDDGKPSEALNAITHFPPPMVEGV